MDIEHSRLLFLCDFPPSNLRGGTVLMSRLLQSYPMSSLVMFTGSYFEGVSPIEGRIPCKQIIFPTTDETGRFGLGRVKSLIDWLLIPLKVLVSMWVVKRRQIKIIVTVAHGHFFVVAALLSRLVRLPLILMVHDDWVAGVSADSFVLKHFCASIFRWTARSAAHIYAVTPYMAEMIREIYSVECEVQMPAIDAADTESSASASDADRECLRIVYAGTVTGATDDSFRLLLDLVKSDKLSSCGIKDWELLLFVMATPQQVKDLGWQHERIKFRGWVSQDELKAALLTADILYLPFSFREEERYATSQAFPSKTADYLKSGKPILICAPPYSSLVRYGREFGFAEIVEAPCEEQLAASIGRIWASAQYREELRRKSEVALKANHDINKQRLEFTRLINALTQ
jgi:glycosyltransferase involved in cell wall biosynthesis